MHKLYITGIGYKPLEKRAKEIILKSSLILASNRLFEVFKGYDEFMAVKDKIKVINNVDETIEFIRKEMKKNGSIVLLASGDPMFFGIGRRAVKEFGKDTVEIIPDLSSIQLAFSRIKEAWDDAFLMSLHGGPDPEKRRRLPYEIKDLPKLIEKYPKIAILTDKENNPSKIAGFLSSALSLQPLALKIYVCERLGYPDERIIEGTPEEISSIEFREPNIIIIQKIKDTKEADILFGLKEDEISHSKGLITKNEIRAVTIHKLKLPKKGVFWDIGAGSGSVSVEVARLFPDLDVFAIEKDKEQIDHIRENKKRFQTMNLEIIEGEAPGILDSLPLPERVFIGGSGEKLKEIMDYVIKKGVKLIVVSAVTIDTMTDALQCFENHGYDIAISGITVSRVKTLKGKRHMHALNPIFIITGERC